VKRQYLGFAGRVANGINVVYASYAAPAGHAVVEARLYVPKDWADDRERRCAAGIPEDLEFKTKPQLAAEIITDLLAEGRCPPWMTGDEVYGRDAKLRSVLEDRHTWYVLKIPARSASLCPLGRGCAPITPPLWPRPPPGKSPRPGTGPGSAGLLVASSWSNRPARRIRCCFPAAACACRRSGLRPDLQRTGN